MDTILVIKGALYFDGDTVLRPHFSGEFWIVDCTEYKTEEVIKQEYSAETAEGFLENTPITVNGVAYFECGYSPYNTDGMELLSDLSELEMYDEETDFLK